MQIEFSSTFNRVYRKRILKDTQLEQLFWKKLAIFQKDPYHPSLGTHKLSGKLHGLFSFKVAYDCRIIFEFITKRRVNLIDIGKHDEVY